MKLTVIVPVSGSTADIGVGSEPFLRPLLHSDTELEFVSLEQGFPSVECELHTVFNAPGIIREAKAAWERGSDGVFVTCFDDPGVSACRELLPIPVLGGYQAATNMARLIADRCAVITTDMVGILNEERKARAWGFQPAAIRSVDMGVLDLRADHSGLLERLEKECLDLWRTEHTGAIILGCTGMFTVVQRLQVRLREMDCPVTVVEPFTVGVTQLENMARLGYSNHMPGTALALEKLNWYERI